MQNEFAAAWSQSNAMFDGDRVSIPAGMFAVVQCAPAYCPITDGMLNNPYRSVVALYGSRRVADYHARKLAKAMDDECGPDMWYEVLPKLPKPVAPRYVPRAMPEIDDEIPF